MKLVYHRPMVFIEEFTPQIACSACGSDTTVIFDCMQGPNRDTESVLSTAGGVSGCSIQAGYTAGVSKAVNQSGSSHSNYNKSLTWSTSGSITATATGSPAGMLYICAAKMSGNTANDYSTNGWTVNGDTVYHTNDNNKDTQHSCTHPMIAPVYGANASSVATS